MVGRIIGSIQPKFAPHNDRLMIVPVENWVHILHIGTGNIELSFQAHSRDITALELVDDGFWTASKDGTIKLWPWNAENKEDPEPCSIVNVGTPIHALLVIEQHMVYIHRRQGASSETLQLILHNLRTKRDKTLKKLKVRPIRVLPLSGGFVTVIGRRMIIYSFDEQKMMTIEHEQRLLSGVNISGISFAVSDEEGRLLIWFRHSQSASMTHMAGWRCSQIHWHSHPVPAMSVGGNKNGLLASAGAEGVVVLTTLHTMRCTFVPRLPPVITLTSSPDGTQFIAGLADNSLAIISISDHKVTRRIHFPITAINLAGPYERLLSGGRPIMVPVPRSLQPFASVVLAGRGPFVQVYDLERKAVLSQMTCSGHLPHGATEWESIYCHVPTAMAIAPSGQYVVSVARKSSPQFPELVVLSSDGVIMHARALEQPAQCLDFIGSVLIVAMGRTAMLLLVEGELVPLPSTILPDVIHAIAVSGRHVFFATAGAIHLYRMVTSSGLEHVTSVAASESISQLAVVGTTLCYADAIGVVALDASLAPTAFVPTISASITSFGDHLYIGSTKGISQWNLTSAKPNSISAEPVLSLTKARNLLAALTYDGSVISIDHISLATGTKKSPEEHERPKSMFASLLKDTREIQVELAPLPQQQADLSDILETPSHLVPDALILLPTLLKSLLPESPEVKALPDHQHRELKEHKLRGKNTLNIPQNRIDLAIARALQIEADIE